jgi:hypothetical protein
MIIVIVVLSLVAPHILTTIVSPHTREAFTEHVGRTVGPDEVSARLAIWRATNPATALQEGQILHYLQVVAQDVDLVVLEVDRLVIVWRRHGCRR